MSALDADVIKTYVELGLGLGLGIGIGIGIGIVATMAFHPEKDERLVQIDGVSVFPPNLTRIAVRCGHYLRGFAYRFIELCSVQLNEATVRAALIPSKDELDLE